jgi:hypothetical protein
MYININVKRKFKINGKGYNSVEEMPHDIREAFEKAIASQAGSDHQATPAMTQSKIIFNGTEYKNIDAMPQDVRQLYKEVLKAAKTGAAAPEIDTVGDINGLVTGFKTLGTGRMGEMGQPTKIEPSFSPRTLLFSLMMVALILLLYYVFHNK